MKKILAVVVAAAFAATSFGSLAQDKKKEDVKGAQGEAVKSAGKGAVTTGTDKPKKEGKGMPLENKGKRKDEKERTDKK